MNRQRSLGSFLAGLLLGALSLTCRSPEETGTSSSPPPVRPAIVRTLPHDTLAFTQGLICRDGFLFESTGQYGRSSLRKIDTSSGEVVARTLLDRRLFGEGLTYRDGNLVQLTWRAGHALVYTYPGMELRGSHSYEGEGWGLTTMDDLFVMSNGSDTLTFLDGDFEVIRRLPVTMAGKPLHRLNELEYARGRIYANVWYSDYLFEIDPGTGTVVRTIDCTELAGRAARTGEQEVLNGIAYSGASGSFYLTGKNWPFIFEVTIRPLSEEKSDGLSNAQ